MRFAALLLLAPMLLSQTSAPAVPYPEVKPEDLCSVEGQILNAVTSAPVKKASVTLMRADFTPGPNGMPQMYSATSDTAGKFAMKGIEPGKYRLNVMRNGFVPASYGSRGSGRPGTMLSLDRAQTAGNIDVRLTPHGIVTGRILDEDGEPVPYVNVSVMHFQYLQGRKQLLPTGNNITNDLGEYRIFGLTPGKYYVSATARHIMLGLGLSVAADRTPQPEEDYLPTYYPGTLDTASAIALEVHAGATLNGINLTLSKSRTVHVRGRVMHTPLPGRRISVMVRPRGNAVAGVMMIGGSISGQVDPKGNFDVRGVPPGAYSIYATLDENGKSYFGKAPVDVGSSNVENVNLTVSAGVDIAGVVRLEGEGAPDLSNLSVRLLPREMGYSFGANTGTAVKADRSFVLQDTAADTYNLTLTGLPNGCYVKAIKSGEVDVLVDGLDASKPAAPLEIVVSPNPGEVNGTVQNSKTNQPAPGASVVLVPQEKERREQQTWYRISITDQNGNYVFKSVPPGDYKAFAWEDLEMGAYLDPEFMKPLEEKGEPVTVKESDRKSITLTMIESEPRA